MSFEFEGDVVSDMVGKLPAMTVELGESYSRGTVLRMQIEVHVKSVRFEENRKGELEKHHVFALDDISLVSAFDPSADKSAVAGSASATPVPTPEDTEALGLEIGRTSDQWGTEAKVKVIDGQVIDTETGTVLAEREPLAVGVGSEPPPPPPIGGIGVDF